MRRAASAKPFSQNIVFPATTAPRASRIIGLRASGRPKQCANYVHLNQLTQPSRLEHRRSCRRRPDRVQFHLWFVRRSLCRRCRRRHRFRRQTLPNRNTSFEGHDGACPSSSKNYRLENWKRFRAPGWPDFFRSFMRGSRRSNPSVFSVRRKLAFTCKRAREIARRAAPA